MYINYNMEQHNYTMNQKPSLSYCQDYYSTLPLPDTTENYMEKQYLENNDKTSTFKKESNYLQKNKMNFNGNNEFSSQIGNEGNSFDPEMIKNLEYLEECQKNMQNMCYTSNPNTMIKNQQQKSIFNSVEQENLYLTNNTDLQPTISMNFDYKNNDNLQGFNHYDDKDVNEFLENTRFNENLSISSLEYHENSEKKDAKKNNEHKSGLFNFIVIFKQFVELIIFIISILELVYIFLTHCIVEIQGENTFNTYLRVGLYFFVIISIFTVNIMKSIQPHNYTSIIVESLIILLMISIFVLFYLLKYSLIYFVVQFFMTDSLISFLDFMIPINCF